MQCLLGVWLIVPLSSWVCPGARHELALDADRWLEIDLYWFKQQDIAASARQFWDRFEPLYRGVRGYRGVILNIGWTVGPVMEWSGNLRPAHLAPYRFGTK